MDGEMNKGKKENEKEKWVKNCLCQALNRLLVFLGSPETKGGINE